MARIAQNKQKCLIFIVILHYNHVCLIKPFTELLEILYCHFIDYDFYDEKVNSPSTQYDFDYVFTYNRSNKCLLETK